ncbi:MAG: replicative DNA helicase, partial [Clostridiales bacterium]|nr:replicative DNA helicase [Clostridiales bacterium]
MSDINPIERKLPFSLEAEQAVLGSVLIAPNSFNEIADIITSDDFYLDEHRELYLTMQELFLQSRDIDLVTVIDMLVRRGIYDATSG